MGSRDILGTLEDDRACPRSLSATLFTVEVDMRTNDTGFRRFIKRGAILAVLVAPLALGACAETLGAGAGAYAGNQFGKGSGKTAATIGGAVGGAIIGHEIAK
jgi:hypothetical protein